MTGRSVPAWEGSTPDAAIPARVKLRAGSFPLKYDYTRPLLNRLMDFVEFDTNGGCWLWTGPTGSGRPRLMPERGQRDRLAYRLTYELLVRPIPQGVVLCHRCDQPLCVNPAHLFPGSQSDNVRDMWQKGRGDQTGLQRHGKGSEHKFAKLTEDDVRLIRRDPRSHRDVARDYGVSKTSISYIRLRKTWGHVA